MTTLPLTNLLPAKRRAALRRAYFFRLATVVALFALVLTAVAALLLIPADVFLSRTGAAREARLASLTTELTTGGGAQVSSQLATLSSQATAIESLVKAPKASSIVETALAVVHPHISITGLSYTPVAGTVAASITITGSAASRDALRAYQEALSGEAWAASANLPVSAYAADTNLPFTISVTLAP